MVLGDAGVRERFSNISNYDALQVILRERASHGLTFLATYTYSHALLIGQIPRKCLIRTRSMATLHPIFAIASRSDLPIWFPGKQVLRKCCRAGRLLLPLPVYSGRAINPTDMADDLSGTGQGPRTRIAGPWLGILMTFMDLAGPGTIPCFCRARRHGRFCRKSEWREYLHGWAAAGVHQRSDGGAERADGSGQQHWHRRTQPPGLLHDGQFGDRSAGPGDVRRHEPVRTLRRRFLGVGYVDHQRAGKSRNGLRLSSGPSSTTLPTRPSTQLLTLPLARRPRLAKLRQRRMSARTAPSSERVVRAKFSWD